MTAKGLPTRNRIVAAAAGFAVAQRHHGLADPAGEDLYPVVVPLVDVAGMLPHDESERVAHAAPPAA
ncbi:hypothetical protein [Streptomyces sp. M54]|uniref:hypothetical protein n=1 Tax=Streptomyces sp. M54 TaxID=2759525 RepID=UPI001A8EA196|nr:hypothetical protein [Streptomyces sp. M54]QSS94829.1 hypothetical protein H3V39_33510 [Streptomyces sp. M54]